MTFCPVKFSVKKRTLTTLALSSLLILPGLSFAAKIATSEWNISADKITRYEDPQSIVAEGNIVLEKREQIPPKVKKLQQKTSTWAELLGQKPAEPEDVTAGEVEELKESEIEYKTTFSIKSDWLAYDMDEQNIRARGNVRITTGEDTLLADQGKVDLTTQTGTFLDAVILRKKDQLHLEGEVIEKTGFNTYHIQNGWAITCKVNEGETPPWSFGSSDTKVKKDGYAVMKHATFNVKGVPVFYTPYMVIPVKNTRQTGFLFPELSSSQNGGPGFNLPFFWNLSDSMDLTLFPEYHVDRGFMPGAEFRYVRDVNSKGVVVGSYLDDDLSDPSQVEYYQDTGFTHTNNERYWARGKADHVFDNNWLARLDFDVVSDRDYLTEFNSGYTGFKKSDSRFQDVFGRGFENKTDDARTNTLKFLKSWKAMSLEADLLAINDVRAIETSPTPLWELPNIRFSGVTPIKNSGISFEWNTDYINYWREDGIGAHRVDLHPSISSSIPLSAYLESRAELGVRDTYYIVQEYGDAVFANDTSQNRLLADFEYEVATTLLRNFALSGKRFDSFDHQLRPFIRYNYIPDVDQDDLPSLDSIDRIEEQNLITYGVDNFFDVFKENSTSDYGYLKISQSYDLTNSATDEPFSDILMRLSLTPSRKLRLEYDTTYDVYDTEFDLHSFEGHYTNSRGDYFSLDYSFNDDQDIEQINGLVRARLLAQWIAELEVEHSISQSETIEANASLLYQALCWSAEFQTNYTPTDTRFLLIFNLANIGTPLGINL